jgi:hypothetical protein
VKHRSELPLPIELVFDILEPMTIDDVALPIQVDIREIILEVVGPSGKSRRVDITKNIDESTLIALEDEILENLLGEDRDAEGSV